MVAGRLYRGNASNRGEASSKPGEREQQQARENRREGARAEVPPRRGKLVSLFSLNMLARTLAAAAPPETKVMHSPC